MWIGHVESLPSSHDKIPISNQHMQTLLSNKGSYNEVICKDAITRLLVKQWMTKVPYCTQTKPWQGLGFHINHTLLAAFFIPRYHTMARGDEICAIFLPAIWYRQLSVLPSQHAGRIRTYQLLGHSHQTENCTTFFSKQWVKFDLALSNCCVLIEDKPWKLNPKVIQHIQNESPRPCWWTLKLVWALLK